MPKNKLLTGSKATLSINSRPILWATGLVYEVQTCSCASNHYPSFPVDADTEARYKLFHLLHKLLHKSPYV